MGTVLITWELGSGMGHLASIRPLAAGLLDRGHRVVVAVKDFAHVHRVLDDPRIELMGTPSFSGNVSDHVNKAVTFAHVLHNIGIGSPDLLQSMASAWRSVFRCVEPDLLIADHSPIALLAARTTPMKTATLGTGFYCPAPGSPLPNWRPEANAEPQRLIADEARLLKTMNRMLKKWGCERLERVTDLYDQADEMVLITYPELDAFPNRKNATYSGIWPEIPGAPPIWPDGNGMKVFVYLRPRPGIEHLLRDLVQQRYSAILRVPGLDPKVLARFNAPNIKWETGLIDIDRVAEECDFCIGHATHVMSSSMLLAGKPMMMVPPFLEQSITAKRIVELGAGLATKLSNEQHCTDTLSKMANNVSCFSKGAMRFAQKYRSVDRHERLHEAIGRLDRLVASN